MQVVQAEGAVTQVPHLGLTQGIQLYVTELPVIFRF